MKLFKQHKPFVIFSVATGVDVPIDVQDQIATLHHLDRLGIPSLALSGRYKDEEEHCILIDVAYLDVALTVAHKYNQESVLYVDEYLEAWLYLTGAVRSQQYIGRWAQHKGKPDGDYTYNPYNGTYYTTIK